MASTMIRQALFSVGEVDIQVWKRTDIDAYMQAAQSLLNMEVGTTGLCKKRKGTRFLKNVSTQFDPNSQLYEYVDKNHNYYIILASDPNWYAFPINPDGTVRDPITIMGMIPYPSSSLPDIDYALDNDSLVLSHPDYPPARIYVSTYNTLPTENVFTYAVLNISPLPVYDFGVVDYSQGAVTMTCAGDGSPGDTLTFTIGTAGFTTDWIGGQIVGAGQNVNQPIGYAIITNVTGSTVFTATIQVPFNGLTTSTTVTSIGSQFSIRQPAFNRPMGQISSVGNPAAVTFYQNRLWFANTLLLPGSIFGSKINVPVSFDVGTGSDTDAIVYNIGQTNSGDILWMNGGKQLEIYSENFEFAAPQNENAALTPATFAIRQQSAYGSFGQCKPTTYINDSYYIAKNGNALINFHFTGVGLTYSSSNISLASQHLVKRPINRALLRADVISQDNFIYYLNNDYSVTAFQFASEFKLAAFTPVDFNTDSRNSTKVFDLVTINNKVYFLKGYLNSLTASIETFDLSVKMDGWFPAMMDTAGNVTGSDMSNLETYYAQITYTDSSGIVNDLGVHQIVSGTCVADNPNMFSGVVQVGLLYDVKVTPMYITPGSTKYVSASGRTYDFKNINRIYVDYVDSLNFYVGGTLVQFQNFFPNQATSLVPKTDTAIVSTQTGWGRFSTFDITQSSPFNLTIAGISYQIDSSII